MDENCVLFIRFYIPGMNLMEWTATAFAGADGVGMDYRNTSAIGDVNLNLNWITYQFFGITGLTWNPRSDMLLAGTLGAGSYKTAINADINLPDFENSEPSQPASMSMDGELVNTTINVQGRADFDWDISKYTGRDLLFPPVCRNCIPSGLRTKICGP
jgi:hypothetical protein